MNSRGRLTILSILASGAVSSAVKETNVKRTLAFPGDECLCRGGLPK